MQTKIKYHFKTECPYCRKTDDLVTYDPAPRVHCGDCLMERTEVVALLCTPVGWGEVPA